MQQIQPGVFFSPRADLPRGRHALDRAEVDEIQRERVMAAFTELVAARGLAAATVSEVVSHAGVSREAFYRSFDNLPACADAAYERFIGVLVTRIGGALDPSADWHGYVEAGLRAYLETLAADPVVARAMQLEMDAAGKPARLRRRRALGQLAELLRSRYELLREQDPTIGPLPYEAQLGLVYAVRQFACDALEDDENPDLLAVLDPVMRWIDATVPATR